jgi:chitin disaccharide deacetylase
MSGMPTPWLARRTLICADDFAYNAACSNAIAHLALARTIDATSAMVLSPRWAQDAPKLHPVRGTLSVGLHLDWTSEYAVAAGHGMGLGAAMLRAYLVGFNVDKARVVIAKQLDLFEAQWGAAPDHIDGHQHVQQFAGIREALVLEMLQRYPTAKPWLRISNPGPRNLSLKTAVIGAMGALRLEALALQAGIPVRTHLSGMYNFSGGAARYGKLLEGWQHAAPKGSVIMCHPATAAEDGDSIGPARVWEYHVLAAQSPAP